MFAYFYIIKHFVILSLISLRFTRFATEHVLCFVKYKTVQSFFYYSRTAGGVYG